MEEIMKTLEERRQVLQALIAKTERRIARAPSGTLCIVKRPGSKEPQYYRGIRTDGGAFRREYIQRDDADLPKQLAQAHYDRKVLSLARRVFYLEHLGSMDDADYVNRNLEKRRVYEENGLFEGEQMLYTWETLEHPLTRTQIERKLNHRLRSVSGLMV